MRSAVKLLGALAATGMLAGSVGAQTCLGRPYFSTGPLHADAGMKLGGGMRTFGAGLYAGADRAFFGGFGVAHVDEADGRGINSASGSAISGRVGYQADLATRTTIQVCPLVAFEREFLDNNSLNGDVQERANVASAGASLGWVIPVDRNVHFVPFAGLAYAKRTGRLEIGNDRVRLPSETYTPGTFGVGMHFGRRWMLTGDVVVPFGLEGSDPVYALRAVVPFGRSR
jgi:hypothetical protein